MEIKSSTVQSQGINIMKKRRRRTSYLATPWLPLKNSPVIIYGYDKSGKFVCRLEINAAGVAVFAGEKGNKPIANHSWERLVGVLESD